MRRKDMFNQRGPGSGQTDDKYRAFAGIAETLARGEETRRKNSTAGVYKAGMTCRIEHVPDSAQMRAAEHISGDVPVPGGIGLANTFQILCQREGNRGAQVLGQVLAAKQSRQVIRVGGI